MNLIRPISLATLPIRQPPTANRQQHLVLP
ncbi:MAG: hypothetical protein RL515_875 [Verrucomicrobiota bacterium]